MEANGMIGYTTRSMGTTQKADHDDLRDRTRKDALADKLKRLQQLRAVEDKQDGFDQAQRVEALRAVGRLL